MTCDSLLLDLSSFEVSDCAFIHLVCSCILQHSLEVSLFVIVYVCTFQLSRSSLVLLWQ